MTRTAAAVALLLLMGGSAPAQEDASPPPPAAPLESPLLFEGQISGTISTSARTPVSGASLAVVGKAGRIFYGSSTNPKGRYTIKGLARDEYSVLVVDLSGTLLRKDGVQVRPLFRNLVDFVTAPAGAPQPVLPLLPGDGEVDLPSFRLAVKLESSEGRPISEAWVVVTPLIEQSPARRARTDPKGEVVLENLPSGYYRLGASALGHVTWSLGPVLLQGEEGLDKELRLSLMPFPLGHLERIENLTVPIQPASPEAFEEEAAPDQTSSRQ